MQSLMGETTAVAHGGDPQDRAAFPRPRCIAFRTEIDCDHFRSVIKFFSTGARSQLRA
ncbi:MAG: hypothetical protein F6J98_37605 [Moorea sp. SIO4G2]|uniref:hypothetical protein n=1 Tax=Moorena bouillonii TaxID=207920 RepID=UPI001301745E|nr:hypothetical protein [Moorena bouillonii]NEO65807.1 hypothetical protein [Moorena sp. SIO4G2]